MLTHFHHLIEFRRTMLPHATSIMRFAQWQAAARRKLIRAEAGVGIRLLRPLPIPNAVRDFLLTWLLGIAVRFLPLRSAGSSGHGGIRQSGGRARSRPAWIGDPQAPPHIYIDLSDVLCHAIWHDTCAGIPRVQLEIAGRLLSADPAVCVFGLHRDKWCDLGPLFEATEGDVGRIFALLKESFAECSFSLKGLKLLSPSGESTHPRALPAKSGSHPLTTIRAIEGSSAQSVEQRKWAQSGQRRTTIPGRERNHDFRVIVCRSGPSPSAGQWA